MGEFFDRFACHEVTPMMTEEKACPVVKVDQRPGHNRRALKGRDRRRRLLQPRRRGLANRPKAVTRPTGRVRGYIAKW